jgi:hypothetical protein
MKQRLFELHKETERMLLDSLRTEELAVKERVIEVSRENSKYIFKYAQSKAKIKPPVGPLKDNNVHVGDDRTCVSYWGCNLNQSLVTPATRETRMKSKFSRSCQARGSRVGIH